MILVYHNIDLYSKGEKTVSVFKFFLQILLLKLCGKKIVSLFDYDMKDKHQFVLRFDDVDKITLKYALPVLKFLKCPAEFFVCEQFVAANDGYWANIDDLKNLVKQGFRLQYHSKNHIKLDTINDIKVLETEIKPPKYLKNIDIHGFKYFAYPCWCYNIDVISVVQNYFKGALSGNGFSNNDIWTMDGKKIVAATKIGELLNE